jgi:hypothetical protein
MLHYYLTEYTPYIIYAILGLFAFIKIVSIKTAGFRYSGQLFVESFTIYSEQSIKNTFHKHLKNYYKSSNKINMLFYSLIGFLVFIYIFINLL